VIPTPRDAVGKPLRVRTDTLNVASFVVQAALALRNGKPKRAVLLLGAASVAPNPPRRRGCCRVLSRPTTCTRNYSDRHVQRETGWLD